ncbi:hypothetical protein BO94DRAFT_548889 [Aspergillus sclerotioniger CBS 115572]|uniref:Uncharacterized protein n=1 Tax=Aspergillus sclerotioniger CBS 115572 TaxID=1450535 RepID=A0A317VWE0_9EURO|nr:hypothetical protein BO94DRAFT_548889 [Aspergillus sclerotioniger CBS 115572]PWY78095.1 hypothetical protein BO94DRAFT_548889 [Aspergillus sclerotioniger CBS 115572]
MIIQVYTGIIILRQHIQKNYAEGLFNVRAMMVKDVKELRERVERVFYNAAGATGCKVELEWFALYEDVVTNDTLAEQYRQYMLQYLGLQPEQMVSVKETRTVHDLLGSSFCEAVQDYVVHEKALRAGKANALISLDMLINDAFATRMKEDFRAAMKDAGRLSEWHDLARSVATI